MSDSDIDFLQRKVSEIHMKIDMNFSINNEAMGILEERARSLSYYMENLHKIMFMVNQKLDIIHEVSSFTLPGHDRHSSRVKYENIVRSYPDYGYDEDEED